MARRKKHPRLPNGYGQIRYLGKNRKNPYGVYPPASEDPETGKYPSPDAICYTDDWYKGFVILTAYKAGTYKPGYELELNFEDADQRVSIEQLASQLLSDYQQMTRRNISQKTFAQVYDEFYHDKYSGKKSYSKSTMDATKTGYKNCAALHQMVFSEIRPRDMQKILDDCPLRYASLEHIKNLFNQIYKYALKQDIVDKNYASLVTINAEDDDEHGVPFTEDEIKKLWAHQDNNTIEFVLIMCYSGFRITAYKSLKVDLAENYFQGGIKTKTSKERIVPIHSAILPLVKRRITRDGQMLSVTQNCMRGYIKDALVSLGISGHTPHDCRHTFNALAEKYGVREADRKRMMGHSFGSDVNNSVYGHRELEDLRKEIEKIIAVKNDLL